VGAFEHSLIVAPVATARAKTDGGRSASSRRRVAPSFAALWRLSPPRTGVAGPPPTRPIARRDAGPPSFQASMATAVAVLPRIGRRWASRRTPAVAIPRCSRWPPRAFPNASPNGLFGHQRVVFFFSFLREFARRASGFAGNGRSILTAGFSAIERLGGGGSSSTTLLRRAH